MTELQLTLWRRTPHAARLAWPGAGPGLLAVGAGLVIAGAGLVTGLALGLGPQAALLVLLIGGLGALRASEEASRTAELRWGLLVHRQASALGLLVVLFVVTSPSASLSALLGTTEPGVLLTGASAQVGVLALGGCSFAVLSARARGARRVMLVGGAGAVQRAAGLVGATPDCTVVGIGLLGRVVEADAAEPDVPVCVVTSLERLVEIATEWGADTVALVPGAELSPRGMRRLSWHLAGGGIRLAILGLPEGVSRRRVSASRLGGATAVEVEDPRPWVVDRAGKLVVDRIGAGLLLLLSLPVLALCIALIRLETHGAALFRQTRVGRDGSTFTMYKLRSMVADAEAARAALAAQDEGNGRLFKIRRDPRVTRVGAVIRKTSLDELPQLLNVVKGEMSLVGPRPALPCEVMEYDEDERRRLAVRPGLTGLWQVSGRSDLSHEESVRLDLEYTDNWDLGEDFRIGLRTFAAVARSRGAY